MIVQIHLDQPHAGPQHFTNLDVLSGKVHLRVPNPGSITSIVVKLEGESRTRLLAPVRPDRPDKQRPVLEVHKFLYKTQILWPTNTRPEDVNPKASFTINSGNYEYPFQFKIPLNTQCQQQNSLTTNVSFANMVPEVARTPTQHIKGTLPPSLSGFPGEAEIRYYVKVTVNLPSFFKENPRATANFTLLPIEPPRPAATDGEAYARRQHQFLENFKTSPVGKKKGLFDRSPSTAAPAATTTPRVTVDARLPNPAILTANQDLPLRLLVKNMSERTKNIYLQMLQIELIGYTKVRAHEVTRTESNSWILASMSNMAIPIGSISDAVGTETAINAEYWSGKAIPNSVAPTFTTCNLSRFYELEVRVGLGYGSYNHGEDQLVVLPLRLPVKVYSGIAPPKALLDATLVGADMKMRPTMGQGHAAPQMPHTPTTPTHQSGFPNVPPVGAGQGPSHQDVPAYGDAPPSYEEAIGQELPPINGYRGSYDPPPVPEGAPRFSDEKRR